MFTFTFFIFNIWTPAVWELSYEFGSARLLVCPFATQHLRNSSSVFSDFSRGFENHKVNLDGSGRPKIGPKLRGAFCEKSDPYVLFYLK